MGKTVEPFVIMVAVVVIVILLLLFWFILIQRWRSGDKRVCIVVLGDIGRSPRMQYHASSFANQSWQVDFIGYRGSIPHADIKENTSITCHYITEPPEIVHSLPRLMYFISKVLWQSLTLAYQMFRCRKPSHILLQNPPALPALAVTRGLALLRGSKLVVDWHNYGYTILGLSLGPKHPLTVFSKWYEYIFGRLSSANICVTCAMQEDLHKNWHVRATTMHDRPPRLFRSIDVDTQHQLFMKLALKYNVFSTRNPDGSDKEENRFTEKSNDGNVAKLSNRPALLISSTSWTEDEDFSILLHALEAYEANKVDNPGTNMPDLVCAITGKGPQKDYYNGLLAQKTWKHVEVVTPWLEAEDYPLLLGAADVGVCLHTSSSGLDLPMKVVDMFGCGLPVCAVHFNCLEELVHDNHNGLVFHTAVQLADQLQQLLHGFPSRCEQLDTFRDNLKGFQSLRWQQAWEANVLPLFSTEKSD